MVKLDIPQKVIPYPHYHGSKPINLELKGHTDIVTFICLIDYDKFASASGDYTIKIWRFDEGICIGSLYGHVKDVWGLAVLTNILLASCSADKTIKI